MVNELDKIEFHDLPVDKIAFDKFNQTLTIVVSIFDEFTESYFSKKIEFQEVTIISFDNILLEKQKDLEIYSFDYEWKNQTFHGEMVFLLGFGKPSIKLEFKCKKMRINTIQS